MTFQTDFADALFDPSRAVPHGLVDPAGRSAGRRFDVYRNNVVVSLTEALETAFPVVRKLVGEANFRVLARAFLTEHPPRTPVLMLWGDDMPGFLETFPPAQSLRYLADVARLEQAMRESYHAADAPALDAASIAGLAPDALMALHLRLAPSVRVITSPWPVLSIWRFNVLPRAPKPVMAAEDVIVTRPEFDPSPAALPAGGAAFIAALARGAALGDALETEGLPDDFDLNATLGLLLNGGGLTHPGA